MYAVLAHVLDQVLNGLAFETQFSGEDVGVGGPGNACRLRHQRHQVVLGFEILKEQVAVFACSLG